MDRAENRRFALQLQRQQSTAAAPSPAVQPRPSFPGLGVSPQPITPPMRNLPTPAPQTTLIPSGLDQAGRSPASGNRPVSGVTADTAARLQQDYGYSADQMRDRSLGLPTGAPANPPQQQSSSSSSTVSSGPTGNLNSVPSQSPGGGAAGGGAAGGGAAAAAPTVDARALLDAEIEQLLEADFIGFQADRDSELRRLRNLRNQMFGDPEFGTTGSVQRQETTDSASRRRLAAQRAMGGMLQGGAYAGPQRGVGTLQRADQDFAMQEMIRPFREQTASDRLTQYGLLFDPTGRTLTESDFGKPDDLMGGWASGTLRGQEASARARNAAIQQLAQRGIQI